MPWKSNQQRKWGHTAAGKKALGGKTAVAEWDQATKGKRLPEKAHKSEQRELMKSLYGNLGLGLSEKAPSGALAIKKTNTTKANVPKSKKPTDPFENPNKLFKKENKIEEKKLSTRKLKDFLNQRTVRKQKRSNLK